MYWFYWNSFWSELHKNIVHVKLINSATRSILFSFYSKYSKKEMKQLSKPTFCQTLTLLNANKLSSSLTVFNPCLTFKVQIWPEGLWCHVKDFFLHNQSCMHSYNDPFMPNTKVKYCLRFKTFICRSSVADPLHFGVDPDPDPRIHASD